MTPLQVALPFALCALAGATLAAVELILSFGKWIGRYWTNRYVLAVIALNMFAASLVYAFLRYALGVESSFWLVAVTGLTFPTILRSRFTFYRPMGKASNAIDTESLSLTLDGWYRRLQNTGYDEVNSLIAGERSQTLTRLRDCLSEKQMIEALLDHITAELLPDRQAEHTGELDSVRQLPTSDERKRRFAALMMKIMPEARVKQLLRKCK